MAFGENLTAYFAEFGEVATWKTATAVTVLFDTAYQLEQSFVQGTNPVITAIASDMPAVAQDDAITVRGTAYTIQTIEYDVTGTLITMQLEKV
jgi:hypothetical protein